jgi:hypothetical protein
MRAAYLVLALAALGNAGCLVLAAGAAAGGAAAFAYYTAPVCRVYNADLENTRAAVRAALADLAMPLDQEEADGDGYRLQARSGNDGVRVHLDLPSGQAPGQPLTRVCVRVATFGDEPLSERLLYQVNAHLGAATPGAPAVPLPPPGATAPPPLAGAPPTTAEPPLAN